MGKAEVIFSSNIPDPHNPLKTFEEYERGAIRCEKMSFHACINPSATDNMSDEKIVEMTRKLMEGLGYGNQPYIIYRHNDIDRVHYHVVSVRVDKNGRKIRDRLEGKLCNKLLYALAKEYGFWVGNDKREQEKVVDSRRTEFGAYKGFNPSAGNYSRQFEMLVEHAMKYNFTTEVQFRRIMESLNVKVGYEKRNGMDYMTFIGLDPKTKKNRTSPMSSRKLNVPSFEELRRHMESCKSSVLRKEKSRVANIALSLLPHATSELHFCRMMEKKGISTFFSKTADGRIYGVTFVDHHNKCCFKASELPRLNAGIFEEAQQNNWLSQGDEKKEDLRGEGGNELSEIADMAISAIGAEKSRRSDDEARMKRGRKGS